ncbi:MAG: hypothetical protein PVF13_05335, partial [Chromatiales bacterium]
VMRVFDLRVASQVFSEMCSCWYSAIVFSLGWWLDGESGAEAARTDTSGYYSDFYPRLTSGAKLKS